MGERARRRAPRGRPRAGVVPAVALGGAFAVLTALVAAGLADRLDGHLLEVFRPGGTWGRAQQVAQRLEGWASPGHLAVALVLTAVGSAVARRRAWPLVVAATAAGGAAAAGLLVKLALSRPDPNGHLTWPGSYPSGHTLTAVVCAGLFWLLVLPHSRSRGLPWWATLLTGLAGVVMAGCLLLEGAHFASDVVGGGLLGAAVLAGTVAALAPGSPRPDARPGRPGRPGRSRRPRVSAPGARAGAPAPARPTAPARRAAPRRRAPARR